jgi:hypothetical protein
MKLFADLTVALALWQKTKEKKSLKSERGHSQITVIQSYSDLHKHCFHILRSVPLVVWPLSSGVYKFSYAKFNDVETVSLCNSSSDDKVITIVRRQGIGRSPRWRNSIRGTEKN